MNFEQTPENSGEDRGAWHAAVHRVVKSWTSTVSKQQKLGK